MLIYLILLLTTVPFLELALLLQVHHWVSESWGSGIGLLVTLGTVIVTGVIGAALAKQQGLHVLRELREGLDRGEMPGKALANGVLVLVGGALLLTPGFLTDLFGFSLLIPFSRNFYREWLMHWAKNKMTGSVQVSVFGGNPSSGPAKSREAHYEPNLSEEEEPQTGIE